MMSPDAPAPAPAARRPGFTLVEVILAVGVIGIAIASLVGILTSTFHGTAAGGREWYYVELSADGTLGHTGRVLLVVAEGVNTGAGVRFEKPDRFAAVLVRRNGEVALSVDTVDFEETALK